ncbi:unnamed protein product, partial [Phaeothamnion confervicola]
RVLCRALPWLDAANDPNQRAVVLAALSACPDVVPAYLASFGTDALAPRANSADCLATYRLLARVLAAAPLGDVPARAGRAAARMTPMDAFLRVALPPALNKAVLTKGVLIGDGVLQAAVFRVAALALQRCGRLVRALEGSVVPSAGSAAAGVSRLAAAVATGSDLRHALRNRLPEVQTLVSLRARLDPSVTAVAISAAATAAAGGNVEGGSEKNGQGVSLYALLLRLLRLYQRWVPEAVAAASYDMLKLLP